MPRGYSEGAKGAGDAAPERPARRRRRLEELLLDSDAEDDAEGGRAPTPTGPKAPAADAGGPAPVPPTPEKASDAALLESIEALVGATPPAPEPATVTPAARRATSVEKAAEAATRLASSFGRATSSALAAVGASPSKAESPERPRTPDFDELGVEAEDPGYAPAGGAAASDADGDPLGDSGDAPRGKQTRCLGVGDACPKRRSRGHRDGSRRRRGRDAIPMPILN